MRIGVDVGGTNTDAVLMKGLRVVASHKTPTTSDVQSGVIAAVRAVLAAAIEVPRNIRCVMIGTTQFTNAFVERRELVRVGVIRLAAPTSTAVPPLYDWPADLIQVVGRHAVIVEGCYEFDGAVRRPLNEMQVRDAVREFRRQGIDSIALSCCFSLAYGDMERRAAQIVREEIPDARVSLSQAVGRTGLLERENATAMNAALAGIAPRIVESFRTALQTLGITAPFFISQNDGTLLRSETVAEHPVLTFASGPTNSMRGAAQLSGVADAIVADIGGTTADLGVLTNSFPRESTLAADIGGVRTNFRMPDLVSIGLGGGSLVVPGEPLRIGPKSVGHELIRKALVFGGTTLTLTDIAVAAGDVDIGDRSRVKDLSPALVETAQVELHRMLENAVERIKTTAAEVPLVLVGGGSMLVSRPLRGVSEVLIPPHAEVANAVGAAIAQVAGEVDTLCDYERSGRDQALADARDLSGRRAIEAGARRDSVRVVEIEEIPVSYLAGSKVRVRVKSVGEVEVEA